MIHLQGRRRSPKTVAGAGATILCDRAVGQEGASGVQTFMIRSPESLTRVVGLRKQWVEFIFRTSCAQLHSKRYEFASFVRLCADALRLASPLTTFDLSRLA
jgi:hypothetical protein